MTDPFDPYYTWLGIPPKDQPPNHYRLLAIERFESNADVIANAADGTLVVQGWEAGAPATQVFTL